MSIQMQKCETDEQWYRLSEFLIKHSNKMNPLLHPSSILLELLTYKQNGGILYGEIRGQIVCSLGYCIGTPDRQFANPSDAFIGSAILLEQFRFSKLFYSGCGAFIEEMKAAEIPITRVYFNTLQNNEYLNRLYGKFAQKTSEFHNEYGAYCTYVARFQDFASRFGCISSRIGERAK
ncbi:hypothetical protein [Paenibacillus sp. GCM10027626]|uniref:hypothetical protein n=1 Tax=Paenibacillus sp. GCM10027626 TaxID=3273411 RepID=UPI00362C4D6E